MNLSEEEKRSSSDYIYKQGKRLERLSYKMMELVRVDKQGITLKPIKARELAYEIERFYEAAFMGEKGGIGENRRTGDRMGRYGSALFFVRQSDR